MHASCILEAGSIKESVYYTNKRDYIDEEWYKIITGAPAVVSENATRLHKLFESKRIEVKHIIQTASQPSSAMNCIPESLNKQPVLTAKPSVSFSFSALRSVILSCDVVSMT